MNDFAKNRIANLEEAIKDIKTLAAMKGAVVVTREEDLLQDFEQAFVIFPLVKEEATFLKIVEKLKKRKKDVVIVKCDCCSFYDRSGKLKIPLIKDCWWMKVSELAFSYKHCVGVIRARRPFSTFGPDDRGKFVFKYGFPTGTSNDMWSNLLLSFMGDTEYSEFEDILEYETP